MGLWNAIVSSALRSATTAFCFTILLCEAKPVCGMVMKQKVDLALLSLLT